MTDNDDAYIYLMHLMMVILSAVKKLKSNTNDIQRSIKYVHNCFVLLVNFSCRT
jgi:hypothetical protein